MDGRLECVNGWSVLTSERRTVPYTRSPRSWLLAISMLSCMPVVACSNTYCTACTYGTAHAALVRKRSYLRLSDEETFVPFIPFRSVPFRVLVLPFTEKHYTFIRQSREHSVLSSVLSLSNLIVLPAWNPLFPCITLPLMY